VRDHLPEDTSHEEARSRLKGLRVADLSDTTKTAAALGYPDARSALAAHPRGFRQLTQVPRLPGSVRRRLVEEFGSLGAWSTPPRTTSASCAALARLAPAP
jgi:diadenylate cyclase